MVWSAGIFERRATPEDPGGSSPAYCVMYFTGFFIIVHSPVSLLYVQLQKASQFLLSMLGLSARK